MRDRWQPTEDLAAIVRQAFADGGTVHTVSAMLGVTPPTLKKYAERLPWLAAAIAAGREDRKLPHGEHARYKNGCRCAACVAANTRVGRRGRAARRAHSEVPDGVEHGRPTTYSNWGCRCQPCTAANTAKSIARRGRSAAERANAQQSAPDGA